MQNPYGLKIFFVINPVSGGKEKHDWEASIRAFFKEKPHVTEFYLLTGNNDRISIQLHLERIRPDRVVAVGGDGTIKMLAELLKETSLPLGILPAGSANGMARALNIPLDIEEALEVIINGECSKIDIIKINEEELCMHLSDVGLNALLVKNFEGSKSRGMWGYSKAIFKVLWKTPLMYATIKTDKEEVRRKAFMIVIANAHTYGTGAIINPDGELDDGLFEVIVIRRLHLFELFKMLVTHKAFRPDRIEIFQTKNLELTLKRKAYFQVDGEYLGRRSSIKARILPKIINVMLPRVKELA